MAANEQNFKAKNYGQVLAGWLDAHKNIRATNRTIINFHCNQAEIINERLTYSTMNDEKSLWLNLEPKSETIFEIPPDINDAKHTHSLVSTLSSQVILCIIVFEPKIEKFIIHLIEMRSTIRSR